MVLDRVHQYGVDKYEVITDWIAKIMVVPAFLIYLLIVHIAMNTFKSLVYQRYTTVFGYQSGGGLDLLFAFYALDIYGCSSQNTFLFMREVIFAKIR